jgi:chromosome segregation ATPase
MTGVFQAALFFQTPPLQKEGLPYWTFWFLLCIILLLLMFIFLRDKDLRQRLSRFLSGARRRMIRLQLETRLKRENTKKRDLFREAGQKAWTLGAAVEDSGQILEELRSLESEKSAAEKELQEVAGQIGKLTQAQEEMKSRIAAQIRDLESDRKRIEELLRAGKEKSEPGPEREADSRRVEELRDSIKAHEREKKEQARTYGLELAEWRKNKGNLQEKIRGISSRCGPLFEELGKMAEKSKKDEPEFALIFSQIDRVDKRIQDLRQRIESLYK